MNPGINDEKWRTTEIGGNSGNSAISGYLQSQSEGSLRSLGIVSFGCFERFNAGNYHTLPEKRDATDSVKGEGCKARFVKE